MEQLHADKSSSDEVSCARRLARMLAPEEICIGDYVTVLRAEGQWPSFYWNGCETATDREAVVRISYIPCEVTPPMKVKEICLPFVFVKPPTGNCQIFDTRLVVLARVHPRFARCVWRALKQKTPTV